MNTLTYASPFALANISVKACFCGKPTVEDHDFCFCSPQCARADAMRALGEDDCHYRKVMRTACAKQGSPGPAIYRHKSENQLRRVSPVCRVSGTSQHLHCPSKPAHENMSPLPTVAEVTDVIPAGERGSGSSEDVRNTSVRDSWKPWESQNESVDPVIKPVVETSPVSHGGPRRLLKRSLPSKAGLNHGVRNSIVAFFRKSTEQTKPLNVIKKVPATSKTVTGVPVESIGEESEEGATFCQWNEGSFTTTRRSGGIRRSASFAGRPAENRKPLGDLEDGKSIMEIVLQLGDVWNEAPDVIPGFGERL